MRLLLLMITYMVSSSSASFCEENAEGKLCDGHDNVAQNLCPGTDDAFWKCTRKKNVRCACRLGYYRRSDHKCVLEKECQTKETTEPSNKPQVETPVQEKPSNYDDVVKFLRQNNTIYLLMIIPTEWPFTLDGYCICVKSSYVMNTSNGAMRTVDCYKGREEVKELTSTVNPQAEAEFEALVQYDWVDVVLNLDPKEKPLPGSDAPDLREKFMVHDVTRDCLLVSYGNWAGGHPKCVLWGFDTSKTKETRCYSTMLNLCRQGMEEIWDDAESCKSTNVVNTRRKGRRDKLAA